MKTALPSFDQLVIQFTKKALSQREAFRIEATTAFKQYTPKKRVLTRSFETPHVGARDVFAAWQEHLLPLHQNIEVARSQFIFRRHIAKHLSLEMPVAQKKAEALISERNHQALAQALDALYAGRRFKKTRHCAERFLAQSDDVISLQQQCYMTYCAYKYVALQQRIVIVDPHAAFYSRMLRRLALWRERRTTITNETKRLAEVHARLSELAALHDGLIKAASENKWDLATAFNLRTQYEKRLVCLSEQEIGSIVRRMAVYDEITREFRQNYIEQYASIHDNLKSMSTITSGIDALLLHLFEMSNAEKNQFMILVKEYRELLRERAAIKHTQEYRFTI